MWCSKCKEYADLSFIDDEYVSSCCCAQIIGDIDFEGDEALEAKAEAEAEAEAWVKAGTEGDDDASN